MSLEYWNSPQTKSDTSHSNDIESYSGRGSTLGKQPQRGSPEIDISPRYAPYPTFARRVKIFKNIATVPDITLNYAQTEGVTALESNSTLRPLFPDLAPPRSHTDMDRDMSPELFSTPTTVMSDFSPIITFEHSDSFLPMSHLFSLLPPDSLHISENACNMMSPIPSTVDLPSLESFPELSNEPNFLQPDNESSPISTTYPVNYAQFDIVVPFDEEKPVAKRRRCVSSDQELETPSASSSTHPIGNRTAKKDLNDARAARAKTSRNKRPTRSRPLSKYVMELSSDKWLKLSPSMTDYSPSARTSYFSPPPSLPPSTTSEVSNVRKRKREMTSPLVTPLQSSLPARSLSVDCGVDAPFLSSSVSSGLDEEVESEDLADDYIHQDFITARAMAQRRSERTKAPINYAGYDDDIPERQVRGKSTVTKAKVKSEEFKAQVPCMLQKKTHRSSPKRPHNANPKCECPFQIICPIPFGRFSDVVRHLESNVLHTHAEKTRWQCPVCGSRLARSDSYKRHVDANACGKRASTGKVKPVYSAEVERELERIRNSDHPAILAAKERLQTSLLLS